ncbi:hypothetical protein H4R18_005814 [Coemansia javaensis]|uniref:Uncharacterized protein n=1 Tax=Coemansia javaensis TaxID=2761396 RepID=A0A9W8H1B6_9FUNG|nr:hypothetical protein H4R18_005814 [Coemansia javaensis]
MEFEPLSRRQQLNAFAAAAHLGRGNGPYGSMPSTMFEQGQGAMYPPHNYRYYHNEQYAQSAASHQALSDDRPPRPYDSQYSGRPYAGGGGGSGAGSGYPAVSIVSEHETPRPTGPKNTVANVLKATVKSISLLDVLPVVAAVGTSLFHHYKHRESETIVPYTPSKWTKYASNAVFAYNAFKFAKDNGFIRKNRAQGGLRSVAGPAGLASRSVATAASDLDAAAYELDVSWAVPLAAAKRHYNCVYRGAGGLGGADAQALGAAAAVRALRGEALLQAHGGSVLDAALAEADALLRRKAAECALGPDDTIERAGRVAIATAARLHHERQRRHMSR